MGMLAGKYNDKRQLKQQQKLQDMQLKGNAIGLEQLRKKEMQMWEDTNYSAQVAQAKKAGMSISALYGGNGAGGATTGGASAAGVSGASAGDPNAGVGMGMQMASQIALMKAQKENIEADTLNKRAEAKSGGVKADSMMYDNEKKEMENELYRDTMQDKEKEITMNAEKAMHEMNIAFNKSEISQQTQQSEIRRIQAEATEQLITNEAKNQGINLTKAQIYNVYENIKQNWKELSIKELGVKTQEEANRVNEENNKRMTKTMLEQAGIRAATDVVKGVVDVLGKGGNKKLPSPKRSQTFYNDGGYKITEY
jgi:hypothetical protein